MRNTTRTPPALRIRVACYVSAIGVTKKTIFHIVRPAQKFGPTTKTGPLLRKASCCYERPPSDTYRFLGHTQSVIVPATETPASAATGAQSACSRLASPRFRFESADGRSTLRHLIRTTARASRRQVIVGAAPYTFVKTPGYEPAGPGLISFTRKVPADVPLLSHSSVP